MKRVVALIFTILFLTLICAPASSQNRENSRELVAQELHTALIETPHCPDNMVEIDGDYCPNIQQECLQAVDNKGQPLRDKNGHLAPPSEGIQGRCGEWKNPVVCVGKTVHKHYCIDRYEYPNVEGQVPQDWMSWYDAKKACEDNGKRMCTRSEWTFAAEGPNRHPYPYGDGFHRDKTICNIDNIVKVDVFKATSPTTETAVQLHNLLVPSGSKEKCVSDWGVYDMAGDIDEWVINESGHPYVSGLMGGHVFGVRNASRPMTDGHGPTFSWYETGVHCCQDAL
jgi:sulfatase modifying factor 1